MAIRRRLLMMAAAVRRVLHSITSATGIVSFSTNLAEPVESLVCEFSPVQSGNGDPSPDNVRPISGWTGIKVYRSTLPDGYKRLKDITFDGNVHYESTVHLIGSDVVTMTITPGLTSGMNVFGCYSGTGSSARNFSFFNYQSSSNAYFRYGTVLLRPNFGTAATRTVSFGAGGTSGFNTNVTTPETEFVSTDAAWIGMLPNSTSAHFNGTITGSIKVGSRMEFIPCQRVSDGVLGYYDTLNSTFLAPVGTGTPTTSGYEGEVVDVDWTSEAGTVYGGTLDVATGVLTVDRKLIACSSLNWGVGSSSNHTIYAPISEIKTGSRAICDGYTFFRAVTRSSDVTANNSVYTFTSYKGLGLRDDRFAVRTSQGLADFVASIQDKHIVIYLATSLTYQLTPQQVSTIIGSNTVWHDGNGAITVDYYDTQ